MDVKKLNDYLSGVVQAEDEQKFGKYGLTHSDGSPCDAKTPESCPHNKRAQKADDLSGSGEVSSVEVLSEGCVKGADVGNASDDLNSIEFDYMLREVEDRVSEFRGECTEWEYSDGDLIGKYSVDCDTGVEEYGKNEDGEWSVQRKIYPLSGGIDADCEKLNRSLSEFGVGLPKSYKIDENDIESIVGRYGKIFAEGHLSKYDKLVVTDPGKFQALKDSYKRGGSKRTKELEDEVREDEAWKASDEYKEMRKKYPALYSHVS